MAKSEYAETRKVLTHQRFRRRSPIPGMLKVIGRIIIIILLFELARNIVGGLVTHPVVARWGTIEKGYWTEALFLRNETVYTAPVTGKLNATGLNGSLVPEGEVIAAIDDGREDSASRRAIQSIVDYQTLRREQDALNQDLKRVNGEIRDKQSILDNQSQRGQRDSGIKEDLNNLEQEKGRIVRNIQKTLQELQKLDPQGLVQKDDSIISAAAPGYLFFQYDSWESQLTPQDFDRLTAADFKRKFSFHRVSGNVQAGAVVAKIIDPFNQRIVVQVDPHQTGTPVEGATWWIKIGETSAKAAISQVAHRPGTGNVLVAMEDPGIGQSILPERRCRIFLVYRRCSGIVVPVQALTKKKHKTMIKLMKGDGYQEKTVRVVESDGERAIIEGIEFGDTIISR